MFPLCVYYQPFIRLYIKLIRKSKFFQAVFSDANDDKITHMDKIKCFKNYNEFYRYI